MDTGHFAGTDDILEDAVCLEKNMFAVGQVYLFAHDRIDKRQFRQVPVV